MPRYFTVAQARELLPRVKALIERAVESKAQYQISERWTHDFVRHVMVQGGVLVDRSGFERNRSQQNRSAERLKAAIEEIHGLGVQVKDLDVGLIDFPTLLRGEEVLLCWRMDEEELGFWHGVDEGFAGRKPINQEFIDHHRGRESD